MTSPPPFSAHRLNPSTFRITEHPTSKAPTEQPQIYLKFYDAVLVIIDTGSVREPGDLSMTLRTFIETVPIAENGGKPLNLRGEREYALVITHCHYDRIGGLSDFGTSMIGASSADISFFAPSVLQTHSLCALAPAYVPTLYLEDEDTFPHVSIHETPLTVLHTPGHTPDSLSLYDPDEGTLFVGDTVYENAVITFPLQGDVEAYLASLDRLLAFVRKERGVTIAAGRGVWGIDAESLIGRMKGLIERVLRGGVKAEERDENGVRISKYVEGVMAFSGPRRVFEEGSRALGI